METTKEIREIQKSRNLSGDTIEDITRKDSDNFDVLSFTNKTFYFNTVEKARRGVLERFDKAMQQMGINMKELLCSQEPETAVEKKIAESGVVVEHREEKGIYFYVRGELAFFISKPVVNQFAIKNWQRYSIQTNISL